MLLQGYRGLRLGDSNGWNGDQYFKCNFGDGLFVTINEIKQVNRHMMNQDHAANVQKHHQNQKSQIKSWSFKPGDKVLYHKGGQFFYGVVKKVGPSEDRYWTEDYAYVHFVSCKATCKLVLILCNMTFKIKNHFNFNAP